VCLLAGEFLRSVKGYIEDGVHPQTIIKAFRDGLREVCTQRERIHGGSDAARRPAQQRRQSMQRIVAALHAPATSHARCDCRRVAVSDRIRMIACMLFRYLCAPLPHVQSLLKLKELSIPIDRADQGKTREMLIRCAGTALNSKLIAGQKEFFAPMVVDAILNLDSNLDLKMVGIKKVAGGSVTESALIQGVAFKKTFAYAGFEQQPKLFINPGILCLNVELELKSERQNAEIRITDPAQYQSIVDAEWNIIYDKLAKIVASGAKVVLSKLPIGDLATQYFADRGPRAHMQCDRRDAADIAIGPLGEDHRTLREVRGEAGRQRAIQLPHWVCRRELVDDHPPRWRRPVHRRE
jgi:hypothetical protein